MVGVVVEELDLLKLPRRVHVYHELFEPEVWF